MSGDPNDRAHAILALLATSLGCAGETVSPPPPTGAPVVDRIVPPSGVLDRGYDPAVVAIDVGGRSPCAGALIAPDVVLTARHCVVVGGVPLHCPFGELRPVSMPPASLRVLVGDDISTAGESARARAVLSPGDGGVCGFDVAALLLDQPIAEVKPLTVRPTGAARGDHVRTVGFASGENRKIVRDHVTVTAATPTELRMTEAMMGSGGGPALDENTAAILGVASRGEADAAADIYTRADAFLSFVESALAESVSSTVTARGASKTVKGPVDMGANCIEGSECAAGVCVIDGTRQYCSRGCAANDRCPAKYRCERSSEGVQVCVEN